MMNLQTINEGCIKVPLRRGTMIGFEETGHQGDEERSNYKDQLKFKA
jgi:hypothetical protein